MVYVYRGEGGANRLNYGRFENRERTHFVKLKFILGSEA